MPAKRRKSSSLSTVDVGHRLAQFRKARNVTQIELAEHLGVTQGNVSLYERGAQRVPTDLVVKAARFLGVTTDELLGLQAGPRPPTMKDRRFLRRLQQIDQLPKRDRDALLRMINACLSRAQTLRAGA